MSLKIIVVGGGIAGLVAATSLRQAGHAVLILEKHYLSAVVGAALHVGPNGHHVLAHLGFDPARARACRPKHWAVLRGQDMQRLSSLSLSETPGHPEPGTLTVHRADLYTELLRLATTTTTTENAVGWGPPVEVRPRSPVRGVSGDGTGVELESGERLRGDLIVGADGLHSVVREYVVGHPVRGVHSGMAAFRFLVDSEKLRANEALAPLLERTEGRVNLLADTTETEHERHIVWYACHGGELQNFVGIHPSTSTTISEASDELKTAMMAEFSHFDPRIARIIRLSDHIKRWPLSITDPLPTWVKGRVVLIGDAAHPMLPFGGQGAAQAMEDGAALGALLTIKSIQKPEVDKVLQSFMGLRRNRTARVQILSRVRVGLEDRVADKLASYLDEASPEAPTSLLERMRHDFSYDVYAACNAIV